MYCINYVIKKGDTLYSISRHFNVSVDAIMQANPYVNLYNLMVDEVLCIPVSIPDGDYTDYTEYVVKEEDSLGSILEENNINLADLVEFNELYDIYLLPGSTLQIPIIGEDNEINL